MKKLFQVDKTVLGQTRLVFQWSPNGQHLALCGSKRVMAVLDRKGHKHDEFQLPAADSLIVDSSANSVNGIAWAPSGNKFASLPTVCTTIVLWISGTKDTQLIDSGVKGQELTALKWSHDSSNLAVGTSKGNLILYNDKTKRKQTIVGKATKKITSLAFSITGSLAIASEEKEVCVANGTTGDTLWKLLLREEPVEVYFSSLKDDKIQYAEDNTLSVNVGGSTLQLTQVSTKEKEQDVPLDLAFQHKYGTLVKHMWYGDGYICLGFSNGYIIGVSTHSKEISEEVYSGQHLEGGLSDMSFCYSLNRLAVGGGNFIKVLDVGTTYKEVTNCTLELDSFLYVDKVDWTNDGQILSVSTSDGIFLSYLASLPQVHAYYDNLLVYQTSLTELSVLDVNNVADKLDMTVEVEPSLVGIGDKYVASAMNNQIWIYEIDIENGTFNFLYSRDYFTNVEQVQLNSKVVVMLGEGVIIVHPVKPSEDGFSGDQDSRLPLDQEQNPITAMCLTNNFIITGRSSGSLVYYSIPAEGEQPQPLNEYRHGCGISYISAHCNSALIAIEDEQTMSYLYQPASDTMLPMTQFVGNVARVLIDTSDPFVLVADNGEDLYTYCYRPCTINGEQVSLLGTTKRSKGSIPICLRNGVVMLHTLSGQLEQLTLDTHKKLKVETQNSIHNAKQQLKQQLSLGYARQSLATVRLINTESAYNELLAVAIEQMDIDICIYIFRYLRQPPMALAFQKIRHVEEKNLLAGYMHLFWTKDYDKAQNYFMRSSQPELALQMRCDLKHWKKALQLAEQLDEKQLSYVSRQYAKTLEMKGEYTMALQMYQQAIHNLQDSNEKLFIQQCENGLTRCTILQGQVKQGKYMALKSQDNLLIKECAEILEEMQYLQDAGELFSAVGYNEKAVRLYIQVKAFSKAAPLMDSVTSAKLQAQFAKANEQEGKYSTAIEAYKKAGEWDNVVRLLLSKVNDPQQAINITRQCKSQKCAATVAQHSKEAGDWKASVEFLVLAGNQEEAYDLALVHGKMDDYVLHRGDNGSAAEYQQIAQYYESTGQGILAGDMYAKAGQYEVALQTYVRSKSDIAVQKCINIIETTKNEQFANMVLDLISGQSGSFGGDTDRKIMLQLQISLGRLDEAAKTAIDIARFEADDGHYKVAHQLLFDASQLLLSADKRVPQDLLKSLCVLHSYIIVKPWVQQGDHLTAARLLIRVAKNISKFQKFLVPILTSTVVECQRAGLKKSAFQYGSMIVRPEYRAQIQAKYKTKIENLVRKPEKTEEEEEQISCIHCSVPGPAYDDYCSSCMTSIPFCIASGKRISMQGSSMCPSCKMPCMKEPMALFVSNSSQCPMCHQQVDINDFALVQNPKEAFSQLYDA